MLRFKRLKHRVEKILTDHPYSSENNPYSSENGITHTNYYGQVRWQARVSSFFFWKSSNTVFLSLKCVMQRDSIQFSSAGDLFSVPVVDVNF